MNGPMNYPWNNPTYAYMPPPNIYGPQPGQPQMAPMPPAVQPQAPQPAPGLLGRAVTGKEEAVAVPCDLMGNPMFFPDLAHGAIYMKRLNTTTGSADFVEFRRAQAEDAVQAPTPEYAPKEDVDSLRTMVIDLSEEFKKIRSKRGEKND